MNMIVFLLALLKEVITCHSFSSVNVTKKALSTLIKNEILQNGEGITLLMKVLFSMSGMLSEFSKPLPRYIMITYMHDSTDHLIPLLSQASWRIKITLTPKGVF